MAQTQANDHLQLPAKKRPRPTRRHTNILGSLRTNYKSKIDLFNLNPVPKPEEHNPDRKKKQRHRAKPVQKKDS